MLRWLVVPQIRRQPWALRLDGSGAWWTPGGPPRPGRRSWAPGCAPFEAYVGRCRTGTGCLLTPAQADFARRARTRHAGHAVLLDHVRATPDELVTAFRPFTGVPVTGVPSWRPR